MTKKKEVILRKFAKDTFDSLPIQEEEIITKEKKGIREGTKIFPAPELLKYPE